MMARWSSGGAMPVSLICTSLLTPALAAADPSPPSSQPRAADARPTAPATQAAPAAAPAPSVLLEGVPWVGFYRGPEKGNPEDHPLPSVMRALMEYLGDDLGLPDFADRRGKWRWSACALFHGVTGSAFGFSWKHPYGEGYLGRTRIRAFDQAFAVAGYDCRMLLRPVLAAGQDYAGPVSDVESDFRRLIMESIRDRRLPVIAIGVIGPDEPCLITGFEDSGNALVGWNFFQDDARQDPRVHLDPAGRFVMRDWFRDLHGIVLPGAKVARPGDRRELCTQALRRDLALLGAWGTADDPRAAAAYDAWIAYLLAPLPEGAAADPRQLEPLHGKHNECVGELAERRAYASTFLSLAAEVLPAAAADLREACHCHQAMHDLLWRVWQTLGLWHKTDDDKLRRFAQPEFRGELASLVRRLQAWDAESARHIRAALVQLGAAATELPALPTSAPVAGLRDLGVECPLPGRLGRLWETPDPVIPGVPAPDGPGLAAAVRAAAAVTEWPLGAPPAGAADLRGWAAAAGWQLKVVEAPPDEAMLSRARRINDVILSCLYGLPVATTHGGKPAVVVGYNHLAGETLRVRLPGQAGDEPAAKIRIDDKAWGPTWAYLAGRRESAGPGPGPAGRVRTVGTRTYIEGIDFRGWSGGEMCEFASALTATLRCAGDEVPYHTVLGVTGVAFRFTFGPELWNPGFYGFSGVAPDTQDLIRRAFAAAGYTYQWYARGERSDDLKRITQSIDGGVGVMLRGHLVDASDWVLVAGYEADGSVLFGASPYGRRDKPLPGLDAMPDWHAKTREYIILGARCPRPSAEAMHAEALRLAVRLVRTPDGAPPYTGLKAYDTLVAALRQEEYPEKADRQQDTPWFRYLCLLCYAMMLDDHRSAGPFLRDAAVALPACRAELLNAAECYERGCGLRSQLDTILPGNFSQQAQQRVLDPAVREAFAKVVLAIRDAEAEGLSHLEQALTRLPH